MRSSLGPWLASLQYEPSRSTFGTVEVEATLLDPTPNHGPLAIQLARDFGDVPLGDGQAELRSRHRPAGRAAAGRA